MPVVTRFSPSVNGGLHLGHAYMILVNERFARQHGGRFVVRFDDSADLHRRQFGDRLPDMVEQQRRQIEWLGVQVDEWRKQSEMQDYVHQMFAKVGYTNPVQDAPHGYQPMHFCLAWERSREPIPYVPYQTAERVWLDAFDGVTHIIRGEEFVSEFDLYLYLCDLWHLPYPVFYFLPRLRQHNRDVSKTNGNATIADLQALGYTPGQVRSLLKAACLISPGREWVMENLRQEPTL